ESVLLNPLTFYWHDGMSLDVSPAGGLHLLDHCLKSLFRPRSWWKFLSGRSKVGLGRVVRALGAVWRGRFRGRGEPPVGLPDCPAGVLPAHPPQRDLPGDLER